MLVMDVDGTLTDGKVYIGSGGELFKAFDIKDGLGIKDILPKMGILPVIITGRKSEMLEARCRDLGIMELHQGVQDKKNCLRFILDKVGFSLGEVAYIGDDINDLECMNAVHTAGGLVGCPADASDDVKRDADFISSRNGGCGAVRELIEWVASFKRDG